MRIRMWGAIVSYIYRNGGEGRGATNPRMLPVFSVREGAERPLLARARLHTTAQPPGAECRSPPLASFDSEVLHELWGCTPRVFWGGLSRVDVGCQKVAGMKGLGDATSCRGLPINGRSSGRRGVTAGCQDPWEFGVHGRRERAATSCRIFPEDGRSGGKMLGDMAEMWQ